MSALEIIIAFIAGLMVNELCDVSPWAAKKIAIWSARLRYGQSARAEIRAEELCAVIESRPGKLFKLMTALAFACGATHTHLHRQWILMLLVLEIMARPPRRLYYVRGHYRKRADGSVVRVRSHLRQRR